MADLVDLLNSVLNRLEALEQYNKSRGHTGPGTGERVVSDDHGVTITAVSVDAATATGLNTGSARLPPLQPEPEGDWEREKRFWQEHPVDRFDLNDPGPGYRWTPRMEKDYSGFGDWVRADDYRKALESHDAIVKACLAAEVIWDEHLGLTLKWTTCDEFMKALFIFQSEKKIVNK